MFIFVMLRIFFRVQAVEIAHERNEGRGEGGLG